jgi:hypothetical protein
VPGSAQASGGVMHRQGGWGAVACPCCVDEIQVFWPMAIMASTQLYGPKSKYIYTISLIFKICSWPTKNEFLVHKYLVPAHNFSFL